MNLGQGNYRTIYILWMVLVSIMIVLFFTSCTKEVEKIIEVENMERINMLTAINNNLRDEIRALENTNSELQGHLTSYAEEVQRLENELQAAATQADLTEEQIIGLENDISNLEESLNLFQSLIIPEIIIEEKQDVYYEGERVKAYLDLPDILLLETKEIRYGYKETASNAGAYSWGEPDIRTERITERVDVGFLSFYADNYEVYVQLTLKDSTIVRYKKEIDVIKNNLDTTPHEGFDLSMGINGQTPSYTLPESLLDKNIYEVVLSRKYKAGNTNYYQWVESGRIEDISQISYCADNEIRAVAKAPNGVRYYSESVFVTNSCD